MNKSFLKKIADEKKGLNMKNIQKIAKEIIARSEANLGAIGITTMQDGENGVFIEIDNHQFKFSKLGLKKLIDKLEDISKELK